MIIPAYLKPGDAIGIVAPAKQTLNDNYLQIAKRIEQQGFVPVMGKTTRSFYGPFAGTDELRASDLEEMFCNPDIKAVLCVRGGYGAIRVLEHFDSTLIKQNPKWLAGFSDITILHNLLNTQGIASIHGAMPVNFTEAESAESVNLLFDALRGNLPEYFVDSSPFNVEGTACGELIGGNLAILVSLIGTRLDVDTKHKILFLEDVGEYLYRLDRMMYQLKMAGKLENIAGLVVGGMSDMKDTEPAFPECVEEIILKQIPKNIPVMFNFPAGHIAQNKPLMFGMKADLCVGSVNRLTFLV